MPHSLPIYPQTVFLDLGTERFSIDTQNTSRLLPLTFGLAQDELDVPFFKLLQAEALF